MTTKQMEAWVGDIGKLYTDRNTRTLRGVELLYLVRYGLYRTQMNDLFIGGFDRDIKILEVGCNIGNQLEVLQSQGFKNLYGVELQPYAVERAKGRTQGINIIQGSAFDIPFKDNYFDMVFTSGVLIHIAYADLGKVMDEIYRCTKKYIWGLEYYEDTFTLINWREKVDLMWKAPYCQYYLDRFKDLKLIKEQKFPYVGEEQNKDSVFLLSK